MEKTFTSWKFEIITTLMADKRVSHAAYRVGTCILQHINEKTKIARLSDETIRDKIGGLSKCRIIEARNLLRAEGWIIWHRPNRLKENYYRFLDFNVNAILDDQIIKKDMRTERRSKRGTIIPIPNDISKTIPPEPLEHSDMRALEDAERRALEVLEMSPIHLKSTP